jgi:hypothetical protein
LQNYYTLRKTVVALILKKKRLKETNKLSHELNSIDRTLNYICN